VYKGHKGPVTSLAIWDTGSWLALFTASWDKTVRVWNATVSLCYFLYPIGRAVEAETADGRAQAPATRTYRFREIINDYSRHNPLLDHNLLRPINPLMGSHTFTRWRPAKVDTSNQGAYETCRLCGMESR